MFLFRSLRKRSLSHSSRQQQDAAPTHEMAPPDSKQNDYVLQTARGSLTGIEVSDARTNQRLYRRFARIRYALPPVGDRRWRRPEPLPPDWIFSNGNNNPRDYRKFGAICPQASSDQEPEGSSFHNDMSEDCLFLNVWVPAGGEGPAGGWPVQFTCPPGDFQTGHGMQQSMFDPIDIFREHRDSPRIIVSANFRCGVFGFLASEELLLDSKDIKCDPYAAPGNFGLYDIRLAIQWTHSNIHLFGGNPQNISVGGCGVTTAFQLHYDAFQTPENRIIRRAFMFSGAVAVQPPIPQSANPRAQFADLCRRLSIDNDLPSEDKVRLLRGVSAEKLLETATALQRFEPVTDGQGGFVPTWFMEAIWDGELGRRLKERKVQVLIGDISEVRQHSQPSAQTQGSAIQSRGVLVARLLEAVPKRALEALLPRYEQAGFTWDKVFSDIMADTQCHAPVRGFAQSLFKGGMTAQDVLRYHIAWRPQNLDTQIGPGFGISSSVDVPIWWYGGWRAGFSSQDKQDVLKFVGPFARFLRGDTCALFAWGTEAEFEVRLFGADGSVTATEDPLWPGQIETWNAMREAQTLRSGVGAWSRPSGIP